MEDIVINIPESVVSVVGKIAEENHVSFDKQLEEILRRGLDSQEVEVLGGLE